jgi:hypothetical protein
MGSWEPLIDEASRRFNVPQDIIMSVMGIESGGRRGAVSPKGASGLMQVMPATYTELAGRYGLGPDRFEPRNNVTAGTAYLRENYDQFGNWPDAVRAYNAGPGRLQRVKSGTSTLPQETTDYLNNPALKSVLAQFGGGNTMPQWPSTQRGTGRLDEGAMPLFSRATGGATDGDLDRWSGFGGLLREAAPNWFEGAGNLLNFGQTPNQPPALAPSAGTTQTQRADVSGRINALLKDLAMPVPEGPRLTAGQYQLAGAADAITPLAATRDRRVGIGELLGALGGGLTRGTLAGQQASRDERANQFNELTNMAKLQTYQRGEATADAKIRAAQQLAAQLRQSNDPRLHQLAAGLERDPTTIDEVMKAIANQVYSTKQPKTVDTAEGVFILNDDGSLGPRVGSPVLRGGSSVPSPVTTADGIFARNPDGSLGPRLGASETAPDSEIPQQTDEERRQLAIANGLPLPAKSPLENPALSPRGRSNMAASIKKQNDTRLVASDEAAAGAQKIIGQMDRFTFLNQSNDTGGFVGSPLVGSIRGMWDAEFKEMQAITAEIAPTLRQPGSGATSDYDAKMFVAGTVGVDKLKETNFAIANGVRKAAQNLIDKANFDRLYAQTYGHLEGADLSWREYLNANPIFDPKVPGSYVENQNRVDWQTYFKSKLGVTAAPKAPAEAPGRTIPPPPPGAVLVPMPGGA